jgi:L-amino acid N-acyltransferase YncA
MDVGGTYAVDLTFEVTTTDYDPDRLARMAAKFAKLLPGGSQILRVSAADDAGVAGVAARVPETSLASALHSVAVALELAASEEAKGLGSLGHMRRAVVTLER